MAAITESNINNIARINSLKIWSWNYSILIFSVKLLVNSYMKPILLLWIYLMSFFIINAQPATKIDSLKAIYFSDRADTSQVNIMNSLALAYFNVNMDSGLYFSDKAFKLAKHLNFTGGILKGYGNYGRALINTGNYQESIKLCKEGLIFMDKLLSRSKTPGEKRMLQGYKATILKNMGISFDYMAIYPEALKYYTECLQLQEAIGDLKNAAGTYHNIGGVYLEYEKLDDALNYFQKAYKINKELGNTAWLTNNLTNIAIVYSTQLRYDLALSTYKEALGLFEAAENTAGVVTVLTNIGTMYVSMNKVDSSIFYMKKVLELNEEVGDPRNAESAYLYLGLMYTMKRDYVMAKMMLGKAGKLVEELEDYGLMEDYYDALYKFDSARGNLTSAIRNLKLSYAYRDSVHNEDNIRKLTQTQMNYDFDKKEAQTKAAQEKKDAIATKELQRQKLMRNWFIVGFAVVLIFAVIFFRQRIRINREKARSEGLLLNILPAEVAEELKEKGNAEAKLIDEVTVLFTDFKGFTQLSEKLTPKELVAAINECFSVFDDIMQQHGVEKIKTIGDAYMAAGGLPTPNTTHPVDVVMSALAIQKYMHEYKLKKEAAGELFFEIRIGVHTGPVVAGIVGIKKFAYDIWGDTVNTASRMESNGEAGKVNISGSTYELVKDRFECFHRGKIQAKGKGDMDMYYVEGRI